MKLPELLLTAAVLLFAHLSTGQLPLRTLDSFASQISGLEYTANGGTYSDGRHTYQLAIPERSVRADPNTHLATKTMSKSNGGSKWDINTSGIDFSKITRLESVVDQERNVSVVRAHFPEGLIKTTIKSPGEAPKVIPEQYLEFFISLDAAQLSREADLEKALLRSDYWKMLTLLHAAHGAATAAAGGRNNWRNEQAEYTRLMTKAPQQAKPYTEFLKNYPQSILAADVEAARQSVRGFETNEALDLGDEVIDALADLFSVEESTAGQEKRTSGTVIIGKDEWMTENLNVAHFRNGDPIPEAKSDAEWEAAGVNKQPAWCYYEYKAANGVKYGRLYNFYAVKDRRGLAPKGWHVATEDDWKQLAAALGGSDVAGEKMKTARGWNNDKGEEQAGGTNSSGFTALPGGQAFPGGEGVGRGSGFVHGGMNGYWWTSKHYADAGSAVGYGLVYFWDKLQRENYDLNRGLSVRCVKN